MAEYDRCHCCKHLVLKESIRKIEGIPVCPQCGEGIGFQRGNGRSLLSAFEALQAQILPAVQTEMAGTYREPNDLGIDRVHYRLHDGAGLPDMYEVFYNYEDLEELPLDSPEEVAKMIATATTGLTPGMKIGPLAFAMLGREQQKLVLWMALRDEEQAGVPTIWQTMATTQLYDDLKAIFLSASPAALRKAVLTDDASKHPVGLGEWLVQRGYLGVAELAEARARSKQAKARGKK